MILSVALPVSAAVEVEDLQGNTLDAYGLDKTLSFTSWGDIPFDVLKEMTQSLSKQKRSAVLANLTAQVLIQPTFITPSKWTVEQSNKWLQTRLQALLNMGRVDLVLQMIKGLPNSALNTEILKIKADALFLTDDWKNACVIAVQNADKDTYLNAMQMLCLGLLGEKDKAVLAFDLWREEQGANNISAFTMGLLMDIAVDEPQKADNLTVADTYVLSQLKSPILDKLALPLPYRRLNAHQYSGFGNAVNVAKLLERWKGQSLGDDEQAYRIYLLTSYADLFLPDLRFIRASVLWKSTMTKPNFSPRAAFLKDKPESQISGGDLLLGLWLLSEQCVDVDRVFLLLNKGGLNLENFVLEQIQ